jgi:hypothetical protein
LAQLTTTMSNYFECAREGDEAYVHTDAWEIGGISMQGVYASEDDLPFDDDEDVDETKESKAGPALGGWSFATQADVASAACVGGHHKVAANQSASTQATRKPPSRPMTVPVNQRQPGQHGSTPRRGALRPGGSVRMMPGPMAGAPRFTNQRDCWQLGEDCGKCLGFSSPHQHCDFARGRPRSCHAQQACSSEHYEYNCSWEWAGGGGHS